MPLALSCVGLLDVLWVPAPQEAARAWHLPLRFLSLVDCCIPCGIVAGPVQPVPLAALRPAGPPACSTGGGQAAAQIQGERGGIPGGTGESLAAPVFECLVHVAIVLHTVWAGGGVSCHTHCVQRERVASHTHSVCSTGGGKAEGNIQGERGGFFGRTVKPLGACVVPFYSPL